MSDLISGCLIFPGGRKKAALEKYEKHSKTIDLDDIRVFLNLCSAMRTAAYSLIFLNNEASDVVAASASGRSYVSSWISSAATS